MSIQTTTSDCSASRAFEIRTASHALPELQSRAGERSAAGGNLRVWSGPDDLFNDAERLVARFKTSRSELYARAIAEFVARHDNDAVTQAFGELGRNINADPSDTQMTTATALAGLRQVEW